MGWLCHRNRGVITSIGRLVTGAILAIGIEEEYLSCDSDCRSDGQSYFACHTKLFQSVGSGRLAIDNVAFSWCFETWPRSIESRNAPFDRVFLNDMHAHQSQSPRAQIGLLACLQHFVGMTSKQSLTGIEAAIAGIYWWQDRQAIFSSMAPGVAAA